MYGRCSGTVTSESFLLEGASGGVGVELGPAEGTECRFLPAEARCVSGVFASLSIRASFLYPLCPLLILLSLALPHCLRLLSSSVGASRQG